MKQTEENQIIIVRGGGDIATGTIYKLYQCGFPVLILETEYPSAIRRNVAFSEAVYQGTQTVEGVTCYRAENVEEAAAFLEEGKLTLLVDPEGVSIEKWKPLAVIDGILAKKNLGTHRGMAPITIALGPGFTAGVDVDAVIETMRGHSLGRVIYEGAAIANTGVPGMIAGYAKERVIHSPAEGRMRNVKKITDTVKKGEVIAWIETEAEREDCERLVSKEAAREDSAHLFSTEAAREDSAHLLSMEATREDSAHLPSTEAAKEDCAEKMQERTMVYASIDGLLRGLIRDGYPVTKGFKIADIDPRIQEYDNCFTISDKARCIGGGVLEALLHLSRIKGRS